MGNDADGDGICGDFDTCPDDAENDVDGDGICALQDICPNDPNNKCHDEEAASPVVIVVWVIVIIIILIVVVVVVIICNISCGKSRKNNQAVAPDDKAVPAASSDK